MDETVKAILAEPDRFLGGTLLDFGQAMPSRWLLNEALSRPGRPVYFTPEELRREWPKRTTIHLIQLEELRYFAVIGEGFGCNGDIAILRTPDPRRSEGPRFPCTDPGEIALLGDNGHEWHLVPASNG
jgi:hypothetical protein